MLYTANPQPQGFSTNPLAPFITGGQRVGPFHEFDVSRLVDIDGDGNPEYLDVIPSQILPYQYFSSYGGSGYRPFGANGMPGDGDDELMSAAGLIYPYITQDEQWSTTNRPTALPGNFHNAKSFQIISPGLDFTFGPGGTYVPGKGLAVKNDGSDNYRDLTARRAEFDNITNFSSGRLGETTTTVN